MLYTLLLTAQAANAANPAGITDYTWLVTGLGFGMVLVLLFVFVYIMKLFGFIMSKALNTPKAAPKAAAPAAKKQYASDADGETKAAIALSLALAEDDDEMAAVAMALHQYYCAHDITPTVVTIKQQPTAWNSKMFI